MSYHTYIAYPKFKDEPIAKEAWSKAVQSIVDSNKDLVLVKKSNSRTGDVNIIAHLHKSKRQQMSLDPYGMVHAQDPNRELIEFMFTIATILGARVYSERLKPYDSPDDWEKRTAEYRKKTDKSRARHKKMKLFKTPGWFALIVITIFAGIFLGTVNAT